MGNIGHGAFMYEEHYIEVCFAQTHTMFNNTSSVFDMESVLSNHPLYPFYICTTRIYEQQQHHVSPMNIALNLFFLLFIFLISMVQCLIM